MPTLDLNEYPISLPGTHTLLTLADVYLFCTCPGSGLPRPDDVTARKPLSAQQAAALVKLAYHVAHLRGAETISSLTLHDMLKTGEPVCPLTLTRISGRLRGRLFAHTNAWCSEAWPMDTFAQMMGWVSSDSLWDRERDRDHLCNMVPMDPWPSDVLSRYNGAMIPPGPLLCKLILELEKRVACAISEAGPNGWRLDTTFGAATALTSVAIDERGSVLPAHEYNLIIFPHMYGPRSLVVHNDAAPDGVKEREHWGYSSDAALVRFTPSLPAFASFVQPAAALAAFIFNAILQEVNWQNAPEKEYGAMAVYFVKLCCVTSGRELATTLATRPTPMEHHLPKLDDEVASCARAHGTDARHTRVFPEFAAAQGKGKGKRKRAQQEEEQRVPRPEDVRVWEVERVSAREDAYYSWRAARVGSKAERQCDEEVLKSAIWHYNVALDNHTEALVNAFDKGRGFNLYKLLLGWQEVYDALGEEGQRLRELRKKLRSAQEDVATWLGKVVDHHKRDAENGVAPP